MTWRDCLLMISGAAFLLSISVPLQSSAQGWEERFQWGRKQQPFLTEYVNRHPPNLPLSPTEVDAYFQTLKGAWEEEVGENADADWKLEVRPYLYYYLIRMQIVGEALNEEVRCHLFAEHMVPTFLADIKRYREEPTTGHLYPIASGTNLILNLGTFDCKIPRVWSSLQVSLEQLPDSLRSHLERHGDLSERAEKGLKRSLEELERLQPLIAIRGALYESNLDVAFAELAAISTKGELANYVGLLGKQLWQSYERANKTDQALATLDLLARSLTAGDLPRDSLRTWYSAVDPEHGSERFQRITGASSPPSLAPAEESVKLKGTYRNLTTGEPFDLSDLEGKTVLLDFWATWCAPCIEEIPKLKRLVSEHGDDFVLVTVSSDPLTGGADRKGVSEFIEKHDITYTALYDDPDSSLTERLEVNSWPSKFLISEDGQIMKHPTDETRLTVTLEEAEAYLKSQN